MTITASTTTGVEMLRMANGSHLDDATTPAAASINLGFEPRFIRVENETDRILFEWYKGNATAKGVKTAAAGTRTLETSGLITVSDMTIGFPVIQNKQYRWLALG